MRHRRSVIFLAAALLVPALPAAAQTAAASPPSLTVVGTGATAAHPDRVRVTFSIETVEAAAADATSRSNQVAAAIASALVSAGTPRTAVADGSYSVFYNPRPQTPLPNAPERWGFVVDRSIVVTADDTARAGAIVDAGIGAGATGVALAFLLRDPDAAYRSALRAAVADAQAQARALAAATGVRLGPLLAIAPAEQRVPSPVAPRMLTAAALPTQLDPADVTAHAQVTLRFRILP